MIKIKQVIRFHSARFAFGCLFAAAAFAISVIVYGKLNAGLFFAVLFITAGTINIQDYEISPRLLGGIYALWLILTAFATLTLSQFCLNEVLPDKGLYVTVFGTMLIIFLYLLPCALTLKIRITTTIVSLILIVFTCLNYFVFIFRGSEIAPADILSVATAGNVAAEYVFFVPATMFYALSLSAAYFFASYALPSLEIKEKTKTRIICFVFAFACGIVMWVGGLSVKPLHWRQTGSVCNGYLFNFTILLRESFPQKPKNYSVKEVNQIASNYSTEQEKDRLYPDIIVVMDESFADLSILGSDLNTDSAITPYIDNLQKNTARGFTLSSVFGGGTPNSEYEFLTGNTFLFLPTGSIAYQQYIKKPCYSIARDLKNKGYTTVAMHQYLSSSWMREEIWPMLGFDECLFLEEFPQEDFLRGWGTDQEMFEKVASVYEEKKKDSEEPVFMFAVTIQNHGGYDYSEEGYTPSVQLNGYSQSYPDVEQYLSCIHETDKATKWLIEYFEKSDRDVVILFYGDHFPSLNEAFFEELHGGQFDTLDEQMLQYLVPFVIWTNYETDSEEISLTSMNYLPGLLLERAGLNLSPYYQYLNQIQRVIPACNSNGYYSKKTGRFQHLEDAEGEEQKALLQYNYLEWNCMFDTDNRNRIFFPVQ